MPTPDRSTEGTKAGEVALSGKSLVCKHEVLASSPNLRFKNKPNQKQHLKQQPDVVAFTCGLRAGEIETGVLMLII